MSFLILCLITNIATVVIVTDTGDKYDGELFNGMETGYSDIEDRYNIVSKLRDINKKRRNKKQQEIASFVEKHKRRLENEKPKRSRVEVIDEIYESTTKEAEVIDEIYESTTKEVEVIDETYESTTKEAVTEGGDPCKAANVCHSQAVCISIGIEDYSCICPTGTLATHSDTSSLYNHEATGVVCKKPIKDKNKIKEKKKYQGTLRGGLRLTKDLNERKHGPLVGVVDDLKDATTIDIDAMIKEHVHEPKHFGIHVSQLETLHPDSVKQHKDMSIIADVFE